MADAYYAVATGAVRAPSVDLCAPSPAPSRAGRTVLLCLAVGAASQGLYWLLTRDSAVEPEAAVRYAFVTTLGVYAVVAALVSRAVRHRLDWRATPLSLLAGLSLGGGLAYLLLRGDTTAGDPRLALMVSEGSFANIAATVLIAVVAAPLCEEVLFRGLLLSSMLESQGRRFAVWVSALAFAAWHLNPGAMPYYTLFGVVFGALYLKRGLVCSIAAHAAFNGTLVVAAIAYATGPGVTVRSDGLVLTAPPGWHHAGDGLHLRGPSAGEVLVQVFPPSLRLDPDVALERLTSGALDSADFTVRPETASALRLPVGDAIRVRVRTGGRDGDVVLFTANGRVYAVELLSGGSPRVRADFAEMLHDLRVA